MIVREGRFLLSEGGKAFYWTVEVLIGTNVTRKRRQDTPGR
jgi:hypothetical protein